MRTQNRQGFTLIELLIVVVVIGILAAIAIPKFTSMRERAFRSGMVSDLKNLANSQEIFYNDNYSYSTSLVALEASESDGVTMTVNEATNTGYAVVATHTAVPTGSCGLFHGTAAQAGGAPATVAGVITCDF